MNSYRRTAVVDRPVRVLRNATAGAVIVSYEDNMKLAVRRHAGITARACPYRERLRCVIPSHRNDGLLALLIVVGVALILVEIEVTIRAAINAQLDRRVRLFAGVFNLRAQR